MSKLAHSNEDTMEQIERMAENAYEGPEPEAGSIYTLGGEERKGIQFIFDNLDQTQVFDGLKRAMKDLANKVLDDVHSHMQDEYILQFEESVLLKARAIVNSVLRGESLDAFGLRIREAWSSKEMRAYDSARIRASLVKDFAAEIQTAEITELRLENERLEKDLQYYKQSRY